MKVLSAKIACCFPLPQVTAASGVEVNGDDVYIVGDNSVYLYILERSTMDCKVKVPLKKVPVGTDGSDIPAVFKPDFECMSRLPADKSGSIRIAAIASGSYNKSNVIIATLRYASFCRGRLLSS